MFCHSNTITGDQAGQVEIMWAAVGHPFDYQQTDLKVMRHRVMVREFHQSIQNTPKATQGKIRVVDYIQQHIMQLKVF